MAVFNEEKFLEQTYPKLKEVFDKCMTSFLATTQQGLNESVAIVLDDADDLTNLGILDPTGLDSKGFEMLKNLVLPLIQKAFEKWKLEFKPEP